MRFIFSILLIVAGLCGVGICLISKISVTSSYYVLDGMELSIALGVFSIVVLLNGLYNLFSKN